MKRVDGRPPEDSDIPEPPSLAGTLGAGQYVLAHASSCVQDSRREVTGQAQDVGKTRLSSFPCWAPWSLALGWCFL